MPQIHYLPDEQSLSVEESDTILKTSLKHDIPHTHVCGGNARCSTCRVLVLDGLEYCPPRNPREQAIADRLHFDSVVRLACQTAPTGDVTVRRLVIDREDISLAEEQIGAREGLTTVGQEQELAILFSDIRGFTSFSEHLLPYDVVHVLNRYFHAMGSAVSRYGGQINNYIGDGMLALYFRDAEGSAAFRAVQSGLDMLAIMDKFNGYLERTYGKRLDIGVGIHTGVAVVGTVGAPGDMRTTAIGDAVNFASRIESYNKDAGTRLLISHDTYEPIADRVTVGKTLSDVMVKGKSGGYLLYEVVSAVDKTMG